jgi:hypothetical protein
MVEVFRVVLGYLIYDWMGGVVSMRLVVRVMTASPSNPAF